MTLTVPTVNLNDGNKIPVVGLGTWMLRNHQGKDFIKTAIDAGYRHFDTAVIYHTEEIIGEAIREKINEGVIKREDVFITSKLWCSYAHPGIVTEACKLTLNNLGLDYIDLYLMHWPFAFKAIENPKKPVQCNINSLTSILDVQEYFPRDSFGNLVMSENDYLDTWKEMELCVQKGLTKSIGVSNFNGQQLDRLIKHAIIQPAINQFEVHPYLTQHELVNFCKENNVQVTASGPLGSSTPSNLSGMPKLKEHPLILKKAQNKGKTPAQIILKYLVQKGMIIIPKTSTPERLLENIKIFDFSLSTTDIAEIESLNCNQRGYSIPGTEKHKYYPFKKEF